MTKMSQSFLNRLNIQLFAGAVDMKLSPGEQARYVNTILTPLGGINAMPLQRYMQQDSTLNAKDSIFYGGKKLQARYRSEEEFEADGLTPKHISGVTKDKLLYSVVVTPKVIEVPLWIDDRSFNKSLLQEESFITQEQISAVYSKAESSLSELFFDLYTNKKRTVKDATGTQIDIVLPATNVVGDSTKLFNDPANIKAFRGLMRKISSLAKLSKREIAVVSGTEGGTEINNCDKFTSKDFNEFKGQNPNQTGINPTHLLGGNLEELITYDEVFYPTGNETVGIITIFVAKSFGQSAKKMNIKPIIQHVAHLKKYFMDVEIELATEIVQAEGVFFFKYKRDIPAPAGYSAKNTPVDVTPSSEPTGEERIIKMLSEMKEENKTLKDNVDKALSNSEKALKAVNGLPGKETPEPQDLIKDPKKK